MRNHLLPRRAAARGIATALIAGGLIAGTTAAADATAVDQNLTIVPSTQAVWISPIYDGQAVAIANGSQSAGAGAIQWNNDGGTEQKWYIDETYDSQGNFQGVLLRNENSGLCLTTDEYAGDQLYQEPCEGNLGSYELFWRYTSGTGDNWFQNRLTGWFLDVSGYSYNEGANIDLWYQNNQSNQDFWVTNTSS
jgi:hypothetical protein